MTFNAQKWLAHMLGLATGAQVDVSNLDGPSLKPQIDPRFGFKKVLNTSREQARRLRQRSP